MLLLCNWKNCQNGTLCMLGSFKEWYWGDSAPMKSEDNHIKDQHSSLPLSISLDFFLNRFKLSCFSLYSFWEFLVFQHRFWPRPLCLFVSFFFLFILSFMWWHMIVETWGVNLAEMSGVIVMSNINFINKKIQCCFCFFLTSNWARWIASKVAILH